MREEKKNINIYLCKSAPGVLNFKDDMHYSWLITPGKWLRKHKLRVVAELTNAQQTHSTFKMYILLSSRAKATCKKTEPSQRLPYSDLWFTYARWEAVTSPPPISGAERRNGELMNFAVGADNRLRLNFYRSFMENDVIDPRRCLQNWC